MILSVDTPVHSNVSHLHSTAEMPEWVKNQSGPVEGSGLGRGLGKDHIMCCKIENHNINVSNWASIYQPNTSKGESRVFKLWHMIPWTEFTRHSLVQDYDCTFSMKRFCNF